MKKDQPHIFLKKKINYPTGKRWIVIDCVLLVLEVMDDHSHDIDLEGETCTGFALHIIEPPTQKMPTCTIHSTLYLPSPFSRYSLVLVTLTMLIKVNIDMCAKILLRYSGRKGLPDTQYRHRMRKQLWK